MFQHCLRPPVSALGGNFDPAGLCRPWLRLCSLVVTEGHFVRKSVPTFVRPDAVCGPGLHSCCCGQHCLLLHHKSAAWPSITRLLRIASTKRASGAAASLQDMAQAVRQKAHRKRAYQKGVRWQIGGDFKIAVSLYILFSKARVPNSVMVEASTLSPMKREAALICADSGWPVLHSQCPRTLAQQPQMLCCCESSLHMLMAGSLWLPRWWTPQRHIFVTMLHLVQPCGPQGGTLAGQDPLRGDMQPFAANICRHSYKTMQAELPAVLACCGCRCCDAFSAQGSIPPSQEQRPCRPSHPALPQGAPGQD